MTGQAGLVLLIPAVLPHLLKARGTRTGGLPEILPGQEQGGCVSTVYRIMYRVGFTPCTSRSGRWSS